VNGIAEIRNLAIVTPPALILAVPVARRNSCLATLRTAAAPLPLPGRGRS
jgi:hypothetical protein